MDSSVSNKILLVLVLVLMVSFGFGVTTMEMDENGNMSDCPFSDTVTICPMGFAEHIAVFQSSFGAIPSRVVLLSILVLAFLVISYFETIPKIYSPPIQLKLFAKNHSEPPAHNKLLLALSDGIIQPKLYA